MHEWNPTHTNELPYLSADVPGIGGEIRQHIEDFQVEEVPAYQPCGEGTHVYLRVEKKGLTTMDLTRKVAAQLGKQSRDVGFAGLKDARAVTRQWLSVEHVDEKQVEAIDLPNARVLDISRHTNKLKLGHLRANRFLIRIRDAHDSGGDRARRIKDMLTQRGMPNYFGPQRFGIRGDNALIGRAALVGDFDTALAVMLGRPTAADHGDIRKARQLFDEGKLREAKDAWPYTSRQQKGVLQSLIRMKGNARRAWRAMDHSLRRLMISAFQSQLFNDVLAARINEIDRLQDGDVAMKHANNACFLVEQADVEQPRCDAFEISPTGPIFGHRVKNTGGAPRDLEDRVLKTAKIDLDAFRSKDGMKFPGERRALRVRPEDVDVTSGTDDNGPHVSLAFTLPPGCYATSVTREVCKS